MNGCYTTGNSIVDEMAKIRITGNIVNPNWFKTILYENGKPNLNAIVILADIVYWHRPTEISDEETGEQMLVYYSLGNYVNWTSESGAGIANRMVGGMADVTIELDEEGKAYIADYGVDAVVCHLEKKKNGITVYPLAEYTEELAQNNAILSQDGNFSLEYCVDLCNQVWGELWK